jgi:hypothetical protein
MIYEVPHYAFFQPLIISSLFDINIPLGVLNKLRSTKYYNVEMNNEIHLKKEAKFLTLC